MAEHDGQDPVTEDQQEVINQLRNELRIANLMLADLASQLGGAQVKLARASAVEKLTQPTG